MFPLQCAAARPHTKFYLPRKKKQLLLLVFNFLMLPSARTVLKKNVIALHEFVLLVSLDFSSPPPPPAPANENYLYSVIKPNDVYFRTNFV